MFDPQVDVFCAATVPKPFPISANYLRLSSLCVAGSPVPIFSGGGERVLDQFWLNQYSDFDVNVLSSPLPGHHSRLDWNQDGCQEAAVFLFLTLFFTGEATQS